MAPQADANPNEPIQSERDLAAEIARAMHRGSFKKRFLRIDSAYAGVLPQNGSTPSGTPSSAPILSPPPMASQSFAAASSPMQAAPPGAQNQPALISPPRSAEWLSKALRERNHARLKNGLAWLSAVAIGGAIITSTILAFQV